MRATRFNHVSIHADDLEESVRFYVEVFGMERIPAPTFEHPVAWLALGEQQLHIFQRGTGAPAYHHVALDVDDFEGAYRKARELGVLDRRSWSGPRVLPDRSVQLYIRDPAGNLVELDWPDVDTLDRSIVADLGRLEDVVSQDEESLGATLYHARERTGVRA
ncbi:MAG: VOC family protein [Actinomycetota bacterium]|nr:VOC family protein [Actinomycetota bacterium]